MGERAHLGEDEIVVGGPVDCANVRFGQARKERDPYVIPTAAEEPVPAPDAATTQQARLT